MEIVIEATIDTITIQGHCWLIAPQIIDLPLKLDSGWLWFLFSKDNKLGHFCSHNVVDTKAHFVLKCPLYNSIRDNFKSLFGNAFRES